MAWTDLERIIANITRRIHDLEVREVQPTTGSTVAQLPTPSATTRGRLRFVTNGRKNGEGAGAGTGTLAYDDGTAWRRASDDTTVLA